MSTREEIVAATIEGSLFQLVLDRYELTQGADGAFVALAAELHNEGSIDLLAVATPEALASIEKFNFFTVQQFYVSVIPLLEAGPVPLARATTILVEAGGEDLASNEPNSAYRDWCAARPERAQAILELIEADTPELKHYLGLTLEAGARRDVLAFTKKALLYLQDVPEYRLGALTALARINFATAPDLPGASLKVIEALAIEEADDGTRTHIIAATLHLYAAAPSELHDRALAITDRALAPGGDGVLDRSSNALCYQCKELSEQLIDRLLTALEGLNPANLGTIRILDVALSKLITARHGARVSALLEVLLQAHPKKLKFKAFKTVAHTLLKDQPALRDDLVVRWLMSGEAPIAKAIEHLVGRVGGKPMTFDIDLKPYKLSDAEAAYLGRKAVGWFFFHPVTAASLLISILRSVKGETAETVGNLLFEPLLLNYSGELKDYLKDELSGPRDRAKAEIRKALAKLDGYIAGLRETGFIAELEPSERERLIEMQRRDEQMRQIQKKAEEASILMSLASKSVILHGNGSVFYHRDANGQLRRHTIKMHGHSTSWEAPRLRSIDPFGLQAMLNAFRAEELRS